MVKSLTYIIGTLIITSCSFTNKPANESDRPTEHTTETRETYQSEEAISTPVDSFFGIWGYNRIKINISQAEESIEVNISWANGAAEYSEWNYPCVYQADTNILLCDGLGTKTSISYDDDNNEQRIVEYTNGRGLFEVKEGKLIWTDATESAAEDILFTKE